MEPRDTFQKMIKKCKGSPEVEGYGEAAVIFIVSRVGSDKAAKAFLSELKDSPDLKEWVYCSVDRLDDNAAFMKRAVVAGDAQNDKDYARKLLNIFLAALDQQTK
ncbi:hypothetical protein ABW20_dc0104526 [Dactylellina cionopaga]|nr:hypothetical protein ABW20_dc0104526 [Dactylellina cionopaga]